MDKAAVRLGEFSCNKKEVSDFITTTFSLICMAQKQGITLPESYFEGVIITTELLLTTKAEDYG